MQFSKNTSFGKNRSLLKVLIKAILFLMVVFIAIIMLNKINFPSPNKQIEKIIPNEKLKVVK